MPYNLYELTIHFFFNPKINTTLLEDLNNFKALQNLTLWNFNFGENTFILKLNNLKELTLRTCYNISFEYCCSNLKKIEIWDAIIPKPNSILKIPNLEVFIIKG